MHKSIAYGCILFYNKHMNIKTNSQNNTHSEPSNDIEERVSHLINLAKKAGQVIREAEKRESPNELHSPRK